MKLSTAIKVLDSQAAWLGISGTALLADVKKHGKILYSDRVCEAYSVYTDYQELEAQVDLLQCKVKNSKEAVNN